MAPGCGAYRINVTFRFKVRRSEIRRKNKSPSPGREENFILKIDHSVSADSDSIKISLDKRIIGCANLRNRRQVSIYGFLELKNTPFKQPFQWLITGLKICFGGPVGIAEGKDRMLALLAGW
jgi:hypothetical protein